MARAIDPKAKAKRQKIVAIVGAVILVAVLAWRVPQMMSILNKKPPPGSNPTLATPSPVAPAVPGAPATPGSAPIAAPVAGALADTDPAPVAGPGQLVSFGRFVSKDPFVQQTGKQCADDAGQTIACPASGGGSGSRSKPRRPIKEATPELSVQPSTPSTKASTASAQISVNGTSEGVSVGATFPVSDPIFKLVAATGKTAKIAIDGGSYAGGEATITLKKGQPVTLVNTADGTRYRLVLQ
jgi:hypothetical protein